MTDEERVRRSEDSNVKYLKEHAYDFEGKQPYVFISYKSDDWETVLHDIVYRLVKDYGLCVYFDGSFDTHNPSWTTQFPANMSDPLCQGVISFVDNPYATSYATLMELMYSQTYGGKKQGRVVRIDLSKLQKKAATLEEKKYWAKDTGLGVDTFDDGTKNGAAGKEKELFDECFDELSTDKLRKCKFMYKKKSLSREACFDIMVELLAQCDINENPYDGKNLDDIAATIKSACGEEVFRPEKPPVLIRECDAYYHYTPKDADAVVGEKDGQYIILKGSRQASSASYDKADKKRSRLSDDGIVVDNIFQEDYIANSPSEAACIIAGGSVNGKAVFVDKAKISREQAEKILSETTIIIDPDFTLPYYHYTSNGANAVVRKIDEKNFVILKGSRWAAEAKYGISISNRQRLEQEGVVENGVFVRDSEPFAGSAAAGIINGGSVSVNAAFTDKNKITEERANEILSNPNAAYGEASKRKGLF